VRVAGEPQLAEVAAEPRVVEVAAVLQTAEFVGQWAVAGQ